MRPLPGWLAILVVLTGNPLAAQDTPLALPPEAAAAEPAPPTEADRQTVRGVIKLMNEHHLSGHPVDDEIGRRAAKLLIEGLDSGKWYFMQPDVDAFLQRADQLDDQLAAGDFSFALDVFRLFRRRVSERSRLAEELLNLAHDFTVDEWIETRDAGFFKEEMAARDVWRKRIKYELLVHKSTGADDAEARQRATRVFADMFRNQQAFSTSDLVVLLADSVARAFDSHSTFTPARKEGDFTADLSGQLVGVGLSLQVQSGYITVTGVIPNGPADKEGSFKANHRLLALAEGTDGAWLDLVGMPLADAVKRIRGQRGSTVRLRHLAAGEFETTVSTLTRDIVEISKIGTHLFKAEELLGGRKAKVGYLHLPHFYAAEGKGIGGRIGSEGVTRDMGWRLKELRLAGAEVIVLDVRNNSGGSLTESINLPGLFLGSEGATMQAKGRDGAVQKYSPEKIEVAWSGPLVILTDVYSAGGTEILAGAIQDAKRGLIVGDPKTQGTGTVGNLQDLRGPAAGGQPGPLLGYLKVITQKFYRPSGSSIQLKGVAVDVPIPSLRDIRPDDESRKPYALKHDEIPAARFEKYDLGITDKLIQSLITRSAQRRQKLPEFQQLVEQIAAERATPARISLHLERFMAEERKKNAAKEAPNVPEVSAVKLNAPLEEMLLVSLDYLSRVSVMQGEKKYTERKFKEAIAEYRRAVAADPTNPDAAYRAAWALATCPESSLRSGKEAVELARQACELDAWQSWRFLLGLAVAEAEAGDFESALKHLKTALEAAPAEQRAAFSYLEQRFARRQKFATK